MLKTIGGDRLGSGNKMKTELHNYERSTHDLGNAFITSMAPGVLVPFYKKIAQNGDTWSINLESLIRTMPAVGPLFGTYKLQMDIFECPIRLYNGILHNNWTKIGMDMSKVKLPKAELTTKWQDPNGRSFADWNTNQISSSSLLAYLGLRGVGGCMNTNGTDNITISRYINAVPLLAYYDIFKNYYANKQEKNAYVIDCDTISDNGGTLSYDIANPEGATEEWNVFAGGLQNANLDSADQTLYGRNNIVWSNYDTANGHNPLMTRTTVRDGLKVRVHFNGQVDTTTNDPALLLIDINDPSNFFLIGLFGAIYNTYWYSKNYNDGTFIGTINTAQFGENYYIKGIVYNALSSESANVKLTSFDLENIDRMRLWLLSNTTMGASAVINDISTGFNYAPYNVPVGITTGGFIKSRYDMIGLCLKTYQSDYFNNWLSSEWIDGINGINAITAIDTTGGSFRIDALNLAHKVYNMLNRIAISGGSYQDWQEAVYGEDATRMTESPVYCGGASGIIAFEEVVSTSDTETTNAGDQPLGTLAGKGTMINYKGGDVEIHVKEPSYIMGIVSITPLINYCQGNDFDITELDSINDIHKPGLDQIGFQNLMLERAAWWGKEWDVTNSVWRDNAVGKSPAWIEYMTSWGQVYGDFAKKGNLGAMVLTRDYEEGNGRVNGTAQAIPVRDFTTYINPTKYNYQFANTAIDAQNFWVQIGINAIVRRKISAKVIPNL